MRPIAAALMFCLWTLGAHATQPVYRCGNVYSQTPCPQGKLVEATDPRSGAQRAEARRLAADERKLAADMRNARLAEESALKPAGAGSLSAPKSLAAKLGSPADRGAKKKKRTSVKPAAGTDFVASGPSSENKHSGK